MKQMSHLELYGSINGCKNGFYTYYLTMALLDNTSIDLKQTDYLDLIDFIKNETDHWNLISADANYNDDYMYYEIIKENNEIKIIIKKGPEDNIKTISIFNINIVDGYITDRYTIDHYQF